MINNRKFGKTFVVGYIRKAIGILAFMGVFQLGYTQVSAADTAEKFKPKEFIMEHVGDAYSWHITTVGHTELSIPLPVILYSKQSGLSVFLSNKLAEGKYNGFYVPSEGVHKGKIVEEISDATGAKSEVRPMDFSITKLVLSLLITVFINLYLFLFIARKYKRNELTEPTGVQNAFEIIIIFVRDSIALPAIGEKRYEKFLPFLLTVFFFILIANLLGLIPVFPGGANLTGNIAITMVLALFTFVITTFSTNKHYWVEIFNNPEIPWWLKFPLPIVPITEVMGVFTKPFVLMIRLFANILAGHMVATVFFSLIFIFGAMSPGVGYGASVLTLAFTLFWALLELLVAFIQAYVFTLLSAVYFGMAKVEHHPQHAAH